MMMSFSEWAKQRRCLVNTCRLTNLTKVGVDLSIVLSTFARRPASGGSAGLAVGH